MTSQLKDPIVGIDLGTTNSLVAIVRDGKPEVLTTREGRRLVPSVVSFAGPGGVPIVGYAAKDNKVLDAEHTIFSVKRLLGRGFEDMRSVLGGLPYEVLAPEEGKGLVRVKAGEKSYTAIEISAMILKELKAAAESALGCPVRRAVITVPAYFNDSQRQATRAAGRLAGLDVLRIVNEPTAASLAYGLDRKKQGLIAVYDLGGGTFDLSILKLHDGIFEVLATHGDTALGGDDLDRALVQVMAREMREMHPEHGDPLINCQIHAAVLGQAETAKIALSISDRAEAGFSSGPYAGYKRVFMREEFESLARPILERTREPCMLALKDAGLKPEDISDVVLVGGPTRLPIVQQVAREIFGREPNTSMHPDEVVAQGAAIQADILAGNNRELLLLDVVPLSLGLETYGGLMSALIPRNTRIPTVAREIFTTFADKQTGIDIHVLQGEREKVDENRSLARFKLGGIPPQPAGIPRIEVTYLIDADGILNVAARDLKTGNEQSVEVRPSYGLTDSEVERMLNASAEHAEEDVAFRKLVEARNDAEPVLRATERNLPAAARLLPAEEAQAIELGTAQLREAIAGADPERIRRSCYQLGRLTGKLADLVVKEAIAQSGQTR